MRAPLDNACDIYRGPGAASPGSFVGTFACRLVEEDAIDTVGLGAPTIPAYLTIEDYQPRGCWTSPAFGMDDALADRVVVPSGLGDEYVVLYTDSITWGAQASYYRAYLCRPAPSSLYQGGLLLGGAATRPGSAEGGLLLGGAATRPGSAQGGLLLGGAATFPAVWRIQDKFNVSNQTNAGRSPDTFNVPSSTWSNPTGTMSVVSNTLQATSFTGTAASSAIDNGQRIAEMRVINYFSSGGGSNYQEFGMEFRRVDANNFMYAFVAYNHASFGNSQGIIQLLGGAGSFISGPTTITIPFDTEIEALITDDGTNMSFSWNGNVRTAANTNNNTGTIALLGLAFSSATNYGSYFDNLRIK